MTILQQAKECYEQMSTFRRKRNRCRDYTFGRQWNDIIEVEGRRITEYEYILREGNVPLKNNLIRRIVRNVIGVFRKHLPNYMSAFYGDADLNRLKEENSLEELFSRSFEEFLISGMAVHRKRIIPSAAGPGIITEIVSPESFFFNTDSRDVLGRDINIIGQVHKVDFTDWCRAFVKTPQDYQKALNLFPGGYIKVKVTEVWRRETQPCYIVHNPQSGEILKLSKSDYRHLDLKEYPSAWSMEEVWRYYFIGEDGTMLKSGDSPYIHGSHPFILKCYPFLEGEIQSLVGDIIDQQRYTNRLITLYDWVIRASAKGVLLIPEGAVSPENMQNVADQWGRFNGVIMYKARPENPEPKQVSGNMSNLGIGELLEIQLKMLEDVSGVNGILQGNTSGGNVSGTLYESQTTNAMYSLSDILETYRGFIIENARKDKFLLDQCL